MSAKLCQISYRIEATDCDESFFPPRPENEPQISLILDAETTTHRSLVTATMKLGKRKKIHIQLIVSN